MNITFKVARLGSQTKEFFTTNGSFTVQDALALAEYSAEGYDVSVDGVSATPSWAVRDGNTVYLVPRLKAGK